MTETPWCRVCQTRHGPREACPGELTITEPERHGWRVLVRAGHRSEVYGVLIAPTIDRWRARVLTYPNMLWSVPGQRVTMKFVGSTAQEAERVAAEFVREHCKARGLTLLGDPAMIDSGKLDAEAEPPDGASSDAASARRVLRVLSARYGADKPTMETRTMDMSELGLFLVAHRPLRVGTAIKILLELEGFSVPLAGRVIWSRDKAEGGRPPGMGVELTKAPPMYHRFVRGLTEGASGDSESPTQ